MAADTKIEWADDSVSIWWGCTHHGVGCKNCYAESIAKRFGGNIWGPKSPRLYIASWEKSLRALNRKAEKEGKPRIVFINSMSDFFEEHNGPVIDRDGKRIYAPRETGVQYGESFPRDPLTLADLRRDAFMVFDECPWLRLLLLTKRPENVRRMWVEPAGIPDFPSSKPDDVQTRSLYRSNVWLGTSISTQADADKNLPELLKCGDLCPVLFVSAEPLIENVVLPDANKLGIRPWHEEPWLGIDWLIVGGESGRDARRFDIEWSRNLLRQCRQAGVPFFMKQLGSRPFWCEYLGAAPGSIPAAVIDSYILRGMGEPDDIDHPIHVSDGKGGNQEDWPDDIRVREFPTVQP